MVFCSKIDRNQHQAMIFVFFLRKNKDRSEKEAENEFQDDSEAAQRRPKGSQKGCDLLQPAINSPGRGLGEG